MSSTAGPELTVHALRAGTVHNDTLHIPTGLDLNWPFPTEPGNLVLRQVFRVR